MAAAGSGRRVLVISTDPAPSLGDALARPLGAAPRAVPLRRGSLHAVEINAAQALDRWLAGRKEALERIALRGTWLDRDDVSRLLRLSMPGIDELAALFEIARFGRSGRFDLIVVDTAPTGHTLRMLAMPGTLRGIARVFDHMQAKHRVMVEALRGGWEPDPEDALIDELDRDGRELAALLRDRTLVRISWVTLPEPMAIEETADAAASLARQDIPLHEVIVNRVTPPPPRPCPRCDARRAFERRAVRVLPRRIPGVQAAAIAAREVEPRGVRALASIGAEIAAPRRRATGTSSGAARWRADSALAAGTAVLATLKGEGTRLLMFGGKGGVGKTTCAAAAALALAAHAPRTRILLLSTDPAHSLGDVFGAPVSDVARPVSGAPPNLSVRELDAAAGFRHVRERYASAIDGLFDRLGRGTPDIGVDARHDRNVMHGLIDLAPPGIDELAAIIDVTDALEPGSEAPEYDLVVMDTAPSGHALRLLEMPALVHDWAKALMAILLKYQPIVGVGELGAVVVKLSQGLGRLRALLADPARTSFVAVTRGAALPRAETVRLLARLRRMRIHVPAVIVNAVGYGTCVRCRRAAAAETREIRSLARALVKTRPRPAIATAPAEVPPPHGAAQLRRWQRRWSG